MKYWLTVHWPPREDDPDGIGAGVWVPDGREAAGADLAEGDRVLVYESLRGRPEVRISPNGARTIVRCIQGREGVVLLGEAQSCLQADDGSTPSRYVDGSEIWWRWHAPLRVLSRSGFVPRREVNKVLGYKPAYNFRGFGDRHSGLQEISREEFEELEMRLRQYNPVRLPDFQPDHRRGGSRRISGESPEHRDLKRYVAHAPSHVLREEGLRTEAIEYAFPTGDCADIVLSDRVGRVIGLEIEVDVRQDEVEGVLQAIKYRRMLELVTRRNLDDSRAILAAHTIHRAIRTLCQQYDVEYVEVSREAVRAWVGAREAGGAPPYASPATDGERIARERGV